MGLTRHSGEFVLAEVSARISGDVVPATDPANKDVAIAIQINISVVRRGRSQQTPRVSSPIQYVLRRSKTNFSIKRSGPETLTLQSVIKGHSK